MKPRIPLTDPKFRYVDSASTNVRATFARARRRIAQDKLDEAEVRTKVREIKRGEAKHG